MFSDLFTKYKASFSFDSTLKTLFNEAATACANTATQKKEIDLDYKDRMSRRARPWTGPQCHIFTISEARNNISLSLSPSSELIIVNSDNS